MSQLLKNKMKIALAQLNPKVGDVKGNISKLISIRNDLSKDVDIIVVPELYVTGYPIDDLVLRNDFLELVENEISDLAKLTNDGKASYNLDLQEKMKIKLEILFLFWIKEKFCHLGINIIFQILEYLMNRRIFTPGSLSGPVKIRETLIGLPICEDIWNETVIDCLSETGAEIIISINASPYTTKKLIKGCLLQFQEYLKVNYL